MEAGVLLDVDGQPIHWHMPPDRSMVALPDSPTLWAIIWENRARVGGFAHSHPGSGLPGPSWEDVTTFAAVEAALGKRLAWPIVSSDAGVVVRWGGPDKYDYELHAIRMQLSWVDDLRRISNNGKEGV